MKKLSELCTKICEYYRCLLPRKGIVGAKNSEQAVTLKKQFGLVVILAAGDSFLKAPFSSPGVSCRMEGIRRYRYYVIVRLRDVNVC